MQQFLALGIPSNALSFMAMFSFFLITNNSFAQNTSKPAMVAFEQNIGEDIKGEGYYKFEDLEGNAAQVEYFFEKKSLPNPYQISYTYNVYKKEDGALEIDLSSAVEPFEMRIDESTEIKFKGDKLSFPAQFSIGQELPDANGIYNMYTKKGRMFLTHEVSITNRVVESKESISIDNRSVEVFVVSHDYSLIKLNQFDVTLLTSKQKVREWIIPGVGVIKQDRTGENIQNGNGDNAVGTVYLINNTAKLKDIQGN